MVRVRRKVRKPKSGGSRSGKSTRSRQGKRKARALMVFVIVWVFLLGLAAIVLKRMWPDDTAPSVVENERDFSDQAMADQRLIQDQLEACRIRLREFMAASDLGGQSDYILHPELTLSRMVRYQQFNPVFAETAEIAPDYYKVIHTPAGRAIETLWKREDGQLIEAVFFEEDGEWKIDWDEFVRAGTEPWALFLAGTGEGEGEFRVLARERIGANGRSQEYIGLVLYSQRPGHPDVAVSGSPEIRVKRNTEMGRIIEETFAARKNGQGPFESELVTRDPDEMIRLRVKVSRKGDDEREFEIVELLANHWMELAEPTE